LKPVPIRIIYTMDRDGNSTPAEHFITADGNNILTLRVLDSEGKPCTSEIMNSLSIEATVTDAAHMKK
jgi:hypothetical protein